MANINQKERKQNSNEIIINVMKGKWRKKWSDQNNSFCFSVFVCSFCFVWAKEQTTEQSLFDESRASSRVFKNVMQVWFLYRYYSHFTSSFICYLLLGLFDCLCVSSGGDFFSKNKKELFFSSCRQFLQSWRKKSTQWQYNYCI